jgi:hypothetical protein
MAALRCVEHAIYTDESGGGGERTRAVAGVAGEKRALAALEARLAESLRRHGVAELKWAQVRTRAPRLRAAEEFLALAAAARQRGLWLAVITWRPPLRRIGKQPASAGAHALAHLRPRRDDLDRLNQAYVRLLKAAARVHPSARWHFFPDQRTGMDFGALLQAAGGARRGWESWAMQRSDSSPLVQLADLLAGLARFRRDERVRVRACAAGRTLPGLPAQRNRARLALLSRLASLDLEVR